MRLMGGAGLVVLCTTACSKPDERTSPLTAYCKATVTGIGQVEIETDYLPHVVQCENGAASFEALKAQAVAARSYLYYRLDRAGEIGDGTSEQVYSCGRSPSMLAYMAADATSGQVLMYGDTPVAAFYVAGAKQAPPACTGGTRDPTATESYVTYNSGRKGDEVEQTTLGWVHPRNHANRGCKSQNGADCLSDAGWRYDQILRFYYGEDIDLVKASGPCVSPGNTTATSADSQSPRSGCSAAKGTAPLGLVLVLALVALLRRRGEKSGLAQRQTGISR